MADELFEFNFEIFNQPVFSLVIEDDIFTGEEYEEESSVWFEYEPDPERPELGITFAELQTLARSNRPDIAEYARETLEEIELEAEYFDIPFGDIEATTYPRPTYQETIGGVTFTQLLGRSSSDQFKEEAKKALVSGGGGGGGGRRTADPTDYGDSEYEELSYYLDEWESDDWQMLRQGYSVEEILVEKWESDNDDYDSWDDYLENRDELDDGDF